MAELATDPMIRLEIDDPIATAVLDRPPVNAINADWLAALNRVLDQVEGRDGVSVLHLRSACKVFCAGADLALMRECFPTPAGRDAMVAVVRDIQGAFARLEALPLVTVAELAGPALGGGLELALACDLRVAAETAKLGLPEAGLGLLPGAGGTQRLPRVCGEAVARRLILGAEVIDGLEAARLGLVQWAVPAAELAAWTRDLVGRLGALPGTALAGCKRCLGAARDPALDGYAQELAETRRLQDEPATQALVRAFLDKSA